MIGEGEILVIDDFVSLEYQEKIKQELMGVNNDFLGFILKMLQLLVILIVNIDQQCHMIM